MIISQTPLRISFVGGGSDLPAFYRQEQGTVVSTAIDKYVYIVVNPKFDGKIRASYSQTEIVDRVDDLQHELIREGLKMAEIKGGIEVVSISDIPSRGTGLGSSSAFTVGLLNALYAHRNWFAAPRWLAGDACMVEISRCGKPIGKQDQYAAAYGGLNFIVFSPTGQVFVKPIACSQETLQRLQDGLLLLYTGLARNADEILCEQNQNIEEKRGSLRLMANLARQMRDALLHDDLSGFGEILHAGWLLKRGLASGITTPRIDEWYEQARAHGAIGGKILGAGGGGFLLLYAPPGRHLEICRALPELRPVDFHFTPKGSRLVFMGENRRQ